LPGGRTIVDVFRPFAYGTAILGEEWVGGEQVTSTVFYIVGAKLRADHYCDLKNQPHYVAKTSSNPSIIEFEFRGATNLDTHPTHFHSTKWRLVDASLVQLANANDLASSIAMPRSGALLRGIPAAPRHPRPRSPAARLSGRPLRHESPVPWHAARHRRVQ